ncbi:MAG: hypothetical protein MUO85_07100, partial [candidate division Zixibacteria bacterium]|nr:hypothetical protein [candidate division Zixibacteria bacterium]
RFDKLGIKPEDIKNFDDFAKLPVLKKDDVKNNLEKLKAKDFEKHKPILTATGGTTTVPLKLYRSRACEEFRKAVMWRHYNYAGYFFRDGIVHVGCPISYDLNGPLWMEDYKERILSLNTLDLSPKKMDLMIEKMKKWKPRAIYGHSSATVVLARYILDKNIEDMKCKAFFNVGEVFAPYCRRMIEKAFGCKTYDYYGMRENTVAASECKEGSYHIDAELVYMEFEKDGRPAKAGVPSNIIGTNLHNCAVPLIRYLTEDVGAWIENECKCGIKLPLMQIIGGRNKDFIVSRDGLITTYVGYYAFEHGINIKNVQIIQHNLDEITLRVVKGENYTSKDEEDVLKAADTFLRGRFKLKLEYMDKIERTKLGKYRNVICEIPLEKQGL